MNRSELIKSVEALLDGRTIIYPKDKFLTAIDKFADLLTESDAGATVEVSTKNTAGDSVSRDIVVCVKTYSLHVADIPAFRKFTEYSDTIEISQSKAERDKIVAMFAFKNIFKT